MRVKHTKRLVTFMLQKYRIKFVFNGALHEIQSMSMIQSDTDRRYSEVAEANGAKNGNSADRANNVNLRGNQNAEQQLTGGIHRYTHRDSHVNQISKH